MSAQAAPGAAPQLSAGEDQTSLTAIVGREDEEQKATEETEEQILAEAAEVDAPDASEVDTGLAVAGEGESGREGEANALTPALSQGEREEEAARREVAARVRGSSVLPPGLRERLASLVEAGGQVAAGGPALVSIDEAIRAVAEALPESLRFAGGEIARGEHPSGDAFFSGRTESELSDQQAEAIAREQLSRSGFLRGHRVRVAQD